ncbi:hypothetical protein ABT002_34775, partial [Streptomyces goshikiensis]
DGIWLAILLGAAVIAVVMPSAPWLISLFGASARAGPLGRSPSLRCGLLGFRCAPPEWARSP